MKLIALLMVGLCGAGILGGCSGNRQASSTPLESDRALPMQGFSKNPRDENIEALQPTVDVAASRASEKRANGLSPHGTDGFYNRGLTDVFFRFDNWSLSPEDQVTLSAFAVFLKQRPHIRLVIEGYCDERGSAEYNLVLGEKRAAETRQYLKDLGVQNQVRIISYGKERPVCAEHDEACYFKNRRAHLFSDLTQ